MFGFEEILARLVETATPRVASFLLLSLRATIVFLVAPWPGRMVPSSIRGMLGITIAAIATSVMPADALIEGNARVMTLAVMAEVVYAGALAFAVWLALTAIVLCGQIGGLQMGFGLRGEFDPSSGSEINAVARIAVLMWMPLALEYGLHHHLFHAMSLPPETLISTGDLTLVDRALAIADTAISGSGHMFQLALVGAGPVFAMSLLSYAGLGAISRAVPNAMIIGEALGGAAILGMVAVGVSASSWPSISERTLIPLLEAFSG